MRRRLLFMFVNPLTFIGPAIVIGTPPPATQESVQAGQEVYEAMKCAECHGPGGRVEIPDPEFEGGPAGECHAVVERRRRLLPGPLDPVEALRHE